MPERDYSNDPDDYNRDYPGRQHPGGVTPPTYNDPFPQPPAPQQSAPAPSPYDPFTDYNNGSPVDAPLSSGHGWEWGGGRWNQVAGRGIGFKAPVVNPPSGGGNPQPAFAPPAPMPMMAPQGPPPQAKTPPITDEVTKMLMQRLSELKNPADLDNDPIYQKAVRANQVALMRGADRQQKALAERSAAGGTRATGGFNVGVRGIQERAGEQGAAFSAGLAVDRLQAREAQLVEAIRLARAVGQDDIANQLEVQRLQLQSELGRGDLALRGELGRGQLGLGYDNLGLGYADLIYRGNRDTVLAGGGGR